MGADCADSFMSIPQNCQYTEGTDLTANEPTAVPQRTPSETDSLVEALEAADLRVLLMCLYQATGDLKWLSDPYSPRRDVRLVGDPDAGLTGETAAEIRTAAAEAFASVRDESPPSPSPELLQRMMNHCLGEEVAPEYNSLVAADLGFAGRLTEAAKDEVIHETDVLIIGTGVSGICLARRLLAMECDVQLIERNEEVGGTWTDNQYPGCGVDTPNHFYSYSFAPNPDWSRYFSKREEIRSYLEDVVSDSKVADRITFGYEVYSAIWDESSGRWEVLARDREGHTLSRSCRVLVSAIGHFSEPSTPHFEDLATFAGEHAHSGRWPRELDLTGKSVAVIGTGATAVQLVPSIVDDVKSLTIFQRTPQWVRYVDKYTQEVDPRSHLLFNSIPNYYRWYRFTQFWRYGDGLLRFLRKDPHWEFPDRSLNKTNDRHRQEMTDYIESELQSRPDLIQKCVPHYPPFAKRILIDSGWYESLLNPKVELVTEPIESFVPLGIRTNDGRERLADVVVFATGFNVTNLAARIDIRGRSGKKLADDWADENPTAYLGMSVPDFPNFFVMYGPNSNMGHGGSVMWLAECQTDYLVDIIRRIDTDQIHAIAATENARREYTELIDSEHAQLVWTHPGVDTYYRNKAGDVRSPMPFRIVDYWGMTRGVDLNAFDVDFPPAGRVRE